MSKTNQIDYSNDSPIVIEFFGLPGAGKTTIANYLSQNLREHGYNVRTSDDFVQWLSQQTKIKKIGFVISNLGSALTQWFWCIMFSYGAQPFSAVSLPHILRVPYVNTCFDRYLKTLDDHIVIMDQANVQLIWSIGAFSVRYDKNLLHRACQAVLQKKRDYVCLVPDLVSNFERIKKRKTQHSRFDHINDQQLSRALSNSSNIIVDLCDFICKEGARIIDIDANLTPEENASKIKKFINGFHC